MPPDIPSGKRLHNYGKSQFLMGKSTITGNFQQLCQSLPEGILTVKFRPNASMCFPFCLSFWLHASVAVRFSHGPIVVLGHPATLLFPKQLGFTDVHPPKTMVSQVSICLEPSPCGQHQWKAGIICFHQRTQKDGPQLESERHAEPLELNMEPQIQQEDPVMITGWWYTLPL